MKYVKILMALAVMCVLTMTAFSMPDNKAGSNDKQIHIDGQKPMGPYGKLLPYDRPIKSIMGPNGNQLPCNCQSPIVQNNNQNSCNSQKSIGQDNNQNSCNSQKSIEQDNNQNSCNSQKSIGQDNNQNPANGQKPMGQNDKNPSIRPIKSMMSNIGNHNGINGVIVEIKVIE